jgi:queuine tRNA-ribosyltransferase
MFAFEPLAEEGKARAGKLVTPHGSIETPSFVAVATKGALRGLSGDDLCGVGQQVIIANTYHLHLQPGEDIIQEVGGLHRFMGWNGPLMTDSGGFQVFSLGAGKEQGVGKIASPCTKEENRGVPFGPKRKESQVKVDDEGVEFTSYLDGSRHRFTPEGVIEIEQKLGADIILVLDECTSPLHDYQYTKAAMERTHRWAIRALEKFQHISDKRQALWGIVQGGDYRDLREESAMFIADQDFDGCAIGGALGTSEADIRQVLEWTIPLLPLNKPRHLLGIGTLRDIFEVVKRGVDLFDCIVPTLMAQTGTVFVKNARGFKVHITNAQYKDDPRPIEENCRCLTCRNHSRAYLRHLFIAKDFLGMRLAAIHNLSFLDSLMRQIRLSIRENRFESLMKEWNFPA